MKKKQKLGRTLLSFLLTLAFVLGLMPGMGLTAYAADYENVEITSNVQSSSSVSELIASMDGFVSLSLDEAKAWEPPVKSGQVRLIRGYGEDSIQVTFFNNGAYLSDLSISLDSAKMVSVKYYYAKKIVVAVNSVTLNKTETTLTVGGDPVALTATVAPNDATDKTVKWSASNANVTLYSDEACTTEVGTDATETLTVYAKGTSAGSATVTVTSHVDNSKNAECTVTVNKADPTTPTGLTATYGQTLVNVTLPTGWTWADGTQSVGSVVSPAATFKANFAGNDNYNAASNVDVAVTVSKVANPAAVTSTATVTKGGNTVDLASNITLNGATGEVTYALDGDANGCTLNGSVLTSGDNTGSVTVNVSVAADDNYNALAATPITVTISDKGTQTITASEVTVIFGETGKKVEATTNGNGAISYAVKDGSADYIDVDAITGVLTIKKVGTATVIVTAAETGTYAQATKEVTVTINKANAVAATVTANNRTYDGTEKPLVTVTGEATGGTMQYALGTKDAATQSYTTSITTVSDAGTYYVWYKVVGDENHNDTEAQMVEAEIEPMTAEVVWDNVDKFTYESSTYYYSELTYNGKEQSPTAFAKGVKGADIPLIISGSGKNVKALFETLPEDAYKAKATTSDSNYTLINAEIDFYIYPKAVTVAWEELEVTYDGSEHAPKVTVISGVAEGDTCGVTDVTIQSSNLEYMEKAVAAGEYLAYANLDNDNYYIHSDNDFGIKTFTIKKAAPTVNAPTGNTLTYNGQAQNLVTAGEAEGGTMYYALGEDATTEPDFDGTSDASDKKWSTSIPTAIKSGTYYAWYKAVGDENHSDSVPACVPVVIESKESVEGEVTFNKGEGDAETPETVVESVESSDLTEFAETQKEESKEVKVELEITPKKEADIVQTSVVGTKQIAEGLFVGLDSEKGYSSVISQSK